MQRFLALKLLILLACSHVASTLPVAYCSPDNVATFGPVRSIYMSNGFCQNQCVANYAFAVIAGQNCLCSNIVPGHLVSTEYCREPCPGYPRDFCGNTTAGYYAYFRLGPEPSSTASEGSSNTVPRPTASTPNGLSTLPVVPPSPTPPSSNGSLFSVTGTFTATNVAAIEQYILSATATLSGSTATEACFISLNNNAYSTPSWYEQAPTQVKNFYSSAYQDDPSTCTALVKSSDKGGLSAGAKAGIAIGSILGALLVGGLVFLAIVVVRRRRKRPEEKIATEKMDYGRNTANPDHGDIRQDQHIHEQSPGLGNNQPGYPGTDSPTLPWTFGATGSDSDTTNGHGGMRSLDPYVAVSPSVQRRDDQFVRAVAAHGTSSLHSSEYETPMETQQGDRELIAGSPWSSNLDGANEYPSRTSLEQSSYVLQQQNPYRIPPVVDSTKGHQHQIPRKPVSSANRFSDSSLTALPTVSNEGSSVIKNTNRSFYNADDDDYPFHAR